MVVVVVVVVVVFVSRDLELGEVPVLSPSTKSFFYDFSDDFRDIWCVDRAR